MAIETTRRRFDSIIVRFATGSPRSISFASCTSCGGVQQLVAADVGEEELQAVGGAGGDRDGSRLDLLLLLLGFLLGLVLGGARLPDLEAEGLQLARELLRLLLGQVVLEHERLELGGLDQAALLRALDERLDLLRLNQFDQLVLRQSRNVSPFRKSFDGGYKLTHHMRSILLLPGVRDPRTCYKLKTASPCCLFR